jgi:hypothetical protein
MIVVFGAIGLAGFLIGTVSVIFPLRFLHIYNRKIATVRLAGSVFVINEVGSKLPDPTPSRFSGASCAGQARDFGRMRLGRSHS